MARSRRFQKNTTSRPPDEEQVADEYAAQELDASPTDQIEVDEPAAQDHGLMVEAPLAEEPAPSSGSSRRGKSASRSSRRMSATSSGRSSAASSRRVLTPEEKAARRGEILKVFSLIGMILVGIAVAGAVWWFFMRTDERGLLATHNLEQARSRMSSIGTAITNKDAAAANGAYEEGLDLLDVAELGFAQHAPDMNDPKLASVELAATAADLKDEYIAAMKPRIERLERDLRVQANLERLNQGFGKLLELDDAALDNLKKDISNFLDNPVRPEAGRDEGHLKDYSLEVTGIKVKASKIDDEQTRRLAAITDAPVRDVHQEAQNLVMQERFKDALAKIDERARQFPQADFAPLRGYVKSAAEQAWEGARTYADEAWKTATAAGTSESTRIDARKAAQTRMQQVADRFGLEEYVTQARQALTKYSN
ncbi:MAG: hypothetical protein H0W72_09430 [Planctomycetes bacterium]|nr:hypothetical protein [Planctomycetota bacterium]